MVKVQEIHLTVTQKELAKANIMEGANRFLARLGKKYPENKVIVWVPEKYLDIIEGDYIKKVDKGETIEIGSVAGVRELRIYLEGRGVLANKGQIYRRVEPDKLPSPSKGRAIRINRVYTHKGVIEIYAVAIWNPHGNERYLTTHLVDGNPLQVKVEDIIEWEAL